MEVAMLTVTASDGTEVQAHDEGTGPALLVLHPGLDDGQGWRKVAARLTDRFRVLRVHRRQYRLDLQGPSFTRADQEVSDVLAVADAVGEPMCLVGHSSGAIIALEALVAAPSAFVGAVVYEPPLVVGELLGGPDGEVHERARAALDGGKPGKAMAIFLTEVVKVPASVARPAGAFTALVPRYRKLVRSQLDDNEMIDALGNRLDVYAAIDRPVLLLGGEKSPSHLAERLDALQRVLPHAERVLMHKRGHDANLKAPGEVAEIVASFADKAFA
jgi:pimeloyl-ACP methyl ester carboxylesterase